MIFFGFIAFAYWCVYLINKIKRNIDTENLNDMLDQYKKAGSFMCVCSDAKGADAGKPGLKTERAAAETLKTESEEGEGSHEQLCNRNQ